MRWPWTSGQKAIEREHGSITLKSGRKPDVLAKYRLGWRRCRPRVKTVEIIQLENLRIYSGLKYVFCILCFVHPDRADVQTVESFYILWKTTGDTRWRERGFSIFQAIEAETRTESGYASIEYVDISPSPMRDEMPRYAYSLSPVTPLIVKQCCSYFLAETLKYLYLLFREQDLIPLDKWVFNTEGHPLPVYTWSAWEKKQYHIP